MKKMCDEKKTKFQRTCRDAAALLSVVVVMLSLAVLAMVVLSGCVSADQESDLPWNAAQPWETAPAGFSNFGNRM